MVKNPFANVGDSKDMGLIPGSGRSPRIPTPGFLPVKSHGQRSLLGYSPWRLKESDTTKWPAYTHTSASAYVIPRLFLALICFFSPLLFSSFSMSKSYMYFREVRKEILIHFSFIQKFVIEETLCAKYLKHNSRSDNLPLPFTCTHC